MPSISNVAPATTNNAVRTVTQVQAIQELRICSSMMTLQMTLDENNGVIEGKRIQQQNAIKDQHDNEEEYKKAQRHKIIHAIVSFFAHVVSLVLLVTGPVKMLAKAASKTVKKVVSKAAGKTVRKTTQTSMKQAAEHAGSPTKMRSKSHPSGKAAREATQDSGCAATEKKPSRVKRFLNSDLGRFTKRITLVNGIAGGLNGMGDGVFALQTADIRHSTQIRAQQGRLIDANEALSEGVKAQSTEVLKENLTAAVGLRETVSEVISLAGKRQDAFIYSGDLQQA
ncbi:hypothetical protein HAX39_24585 [Citrobacter freundii]|nr:hypothetical protein [Citrobacter freundii]